MRSLLLRAFLLSITIVTIAVVITMTLQKTNKYQDIPYLSPEIQKLEGWTDISNAVSVMLIAATFLVGATSFVLNGKLTREKNGLLVKMMADISVANKEALDAKARAEEATAQQRELEQRNFQLAIELERLKLLAGDRFIPKIIGEQLVAELSKTSGRTAHFEVIGTDNEPETFARQLSGLFLATQWKVTLSKTGIMIPRPTGIEVYANGDKNNAMGKAIVELFGQLGYRCVFKSGQKNPDVDLWIVIAPKE